MYINRIDDSRVELKLINGDEVISIIYDLTLPGDFKFLVRLIVAAEAMLKGDYSVITVDLKPTKGRIASLILMNHENQFYYRYSEMNTLNLRVEERILKGQFLSRELLEISTIGKECILAN